MDVHPTNIDNYHIPICQTKNWIVSICCQNLSQYLQIFVMDLSRQSCHINVRIHYMYLYVRVDVRKMLQDMPEYIILGQATFQGIRQSKCQNAFGYMSEHMIKPYVRQYVRQYNRQYVGQLPYNISDNVSEWISVKSGYIRVSSFISS